MTPEQDPAAAARAIIDEIEYMTLATADEDGLPWASPVWFAAVSYAELLWVSKPEARHSRNLAVRPQLSIVIFDSRQPEGTGQGVYMSAVAEQLTGPELDDGIAALSRISQEQGGEEWTVDDVVQPAPHRLYRAIASEQFVLGDHDRRKRVSLDR
jgi:nitroimidazol reductase NimA-like FMN-containing flavoprotein (pyridoxamine 5'-phosphate oxidase superfamily)